VHTSFLLIVGGKSCFTVPSVIRDYSAGTSRIHQKI
jgi:hypothetical protein